MNFWEYRVQKKRKTCPLLRFVCFKLFAEAQFPALKLICMRCPTRGDGTFCGVVWWVDTILPGLAPPPKKKTSHFLFLPERKTFSLSWLEGDAPTGYLWDSLTPGTLWPLGPCSLRQSLTGNNATDCCCRRRCLRPLLNWNETKWHEMSCLVAASVLFFLLGLLLLLLMMISAVSMESSLLCFFGLVCFFEPVFRPVVVVLWSD